MAGLTVLGTLAKVASVAGTIVTTVGAIQQGKDARAVREYEAKQLDVQASNEYATANKRAAELRRRTRLDQSRARAVGAAFGGGVDYDIIGDLEEVGELNALTALWEGDEARQGRRAQAAVSRAEGKQMEKAGYLKGVSTILSGGSSFYDKYWNEKKT